MWVETPEGKALVPDDLRHETFADSPDSAFGEYFEMIALLENRLRNHEDADLMYQLLFQREAQTFCPRLSGNKAQDIAYKNVPFIPYHIFDSVESYNYAVAAHYAWKNRKRSPFSEQFLRQVHRRLLPHLPHAGKLRVKSVFIGTRDSKLPDAKILLGPPEYVRPALAQMAQFGASVLPTHRLASCAMLHYQIVGIHPFTDGNGRTARAATTALLRHFNLIEEPCLFVSEIFLQRGTDYAARLEAVDKYKEIKAWIRVFVEMLIEQTHRNLTLIRIASRLYSDLQSRFVGLVPAAQIPSLVSNIILSPSMSTTRFAELVKCDASAAKALLKRLTGVFGLQMIVESLDPVYQFGDVYEILAV